MTTLKIEYPSEVLQALELEADEFHEQARLLLGLKLYETGKLSTSLAAKLAGVPRETFIFLLGRHGLSPFGEEPSELAQDLESARLADQREESDDGWSSRFVETVEAAGTDEEAGEELEEMRRAIRANRGTRDHDA